MKTIESIDTKKSHRQNKSSERSTYAKKDTHDSHSRTEQIESLKSELAQKDTQISDMQAKFVSVLKQKDNLIEQLKLIIAASEQKHTDQLSQLSTKNCQLQSQITILENIILKERKQRN